MPNTRNSSTSSSKRQRVAFQDLSYESGYSISHLSSADKAFIRDLIVESENITSQAIENSIKRSEEKHFAIIKKLIQESEEKILAEIDKKFVPIQKELNELTDRVNNLEIKIKEKNENNAELNELKKKIMKYENSQVANSLRIVGVPHNENEDLNMIFNKICETINISMPLEKIYRLNKIYKNHKPYTPNDEVIVAVLKTPYDRNFMLKCIAKYKKDKNCLLDLSHIGYVQHNENAAHPIYVNENLTTHNFNIFKESLKLKKHGKIKSTFTLRGLVYVKRSVAEEPILIEFLDQLNQLFL